MGNATFPTTPDEFMKECGKFFTRIGDKSHTQEQIQGAFRALTLQYLGLSDDPDERCADMFMVMTDNAIARGWEL